MHGTSHIRRMFVCNIHGKRCSESFNSMTGGFMFVHVINKLEQNSKRIRAKRKIMDKIN